MIYLKATTIVLCFALVTAAYSSPPSHHGRSSSSGKSSSKSGSSSSSGSHSSKSSKSGSSSSSGKSSSSSKSSSPGSSGGQSSSSSHEHGSLYEGHSGGHGYSLFSGGGHQSHQYSLFSGGGGGHQQGHEYNLGLGNSHTHTTAEKTVESPKQTQDKILSATDPVNQKKEETSAKPCFVEGTQVHVWNATSKEVTLTPIENVKIDDLVVSCHFFHFPDTENITCDLKKVEDVSEHYTQELTYVKTANATIVATLDHPFYVPHEGWVKAHELAPGDELYQQNGLPVEITGIESVYLDQEVKVYNLQIDGATNDDSNYCVGTDGFLVHNCGATEDFAKGFALGASESLPGASQDYPRGSDAFEAGRTAGKLAGASGQVIAGTAGMAAGGAEAVISCAGAGCVAAPVGVATAGAGAAVAGHGVKVIVDTMQKMEGSKDRDSARDTTAKFPSAKEMGKRLGVSEEEFHRDVKPEMLKQFKKESQQIGAKNPNIGVDESGNVVLQHPKTKQTVKTGVPLDSFGE